MVHHDLPLEAEEQRDGSEMEGERTCRVFERVCPAAYFHMKNSGSASQEYPAEHRPRISAWYKMGP